MGTFLHLLSVRDLHQSGNLNTLADFYINTIQLHEAIGSLLESALDPESILNKKVLLKPNWVYHSRRSTDEICLRTHNNFIIEVLSHIIDLKPSEIVIGDAPIQGCNWDEVVSQSFQSTIQQLSEEHGIPILIKDFRRRIYSVSENSPLEKVKPLDEYIIFDLGKKSFLEPITVKGESMFRVTNYHPDRMSMAHAPGVHKYCLTKELFDADVVISLPKIKTHQKTGITGALKNLVGINGDKDFLPHHRLGGTRFGGDCYPGGSFLRYWSELALDKANRNQGTKNFWIWQKLSSLLWRLSLPGQVHHMAAGWHGNDTSWRMVLDLNKVAKFGKSDGTISSQPQRIIYSICDAIVGGQGDGPLDPEPLPLGIISVTNNSLLNDRAMAILMGFQPEMIPLLGEHNLDGLTDSEILLDGAKVKLEDLEEYAINVRPPEGWINYFKERK